MPPSNFHFSGKLCNKDPKCTHFNWVHPNYPFSKDILKNCYLRQGDPLKLVEKTGVISGTEGCVLASNDFGGRGKNF